MTVVRHRQVCRKFMPIFTPLVGAPCFVNSKWRGIDVVRPAYVRELSYDHSWIDRLNTQLEVPLMECIGRVQQRAGAWPNLLAWHSLPETRRYRQGRDVGWTGRTESSFFPPENFAACNATFTHFQHLFPTLQAQIQSSNKGALKVKVKVNVDLYSASSWSHL